jgi:hypothetical protein
MLMKRWKIRKVGQRWMGISRIQQSGFQDTAKWLPGYSKVASNIYQEHKKHTPEGLNDTV